MALPVARPQHGTNVVAGGAVPAAAAGHVLTGGRPGWPGTATAAHCVARYFPDYFGLERVCWGTNGVGGLW